jgi:hypothetical protein
MKNPLEVGNLIKIGSHNDRTLWGALSHRGEHYLREDRVMGGHLRRGSLPILGEVGLIVAKEKNYLDQALSYTIRIKERNFVCRSLYAEKYLTLITGNTL